MMDYHTNNGITSCIAPLQINVHLLTSLQWSTKDPCLGMREVGIIWNLEDELHRLMKGQVDISERWSGICIRVPEYVCMWEGEG